MHVQLLVSQVRSQRKRWPGSEGSVNSTHTRGRSRGASATGTPYAVDVSPACLAHLLDGHGPMSRPYAVHPVGVARAARAASVSA